MKVSEIKWSLVESADVQRAHIFKGREQYYVMKDAQDVYAIYHPMHNKFDKWGLDILELAAYLTLFTPEITHVEDQGN